MAKKVVSWRNAHGDEVRVDLSRRVSLWGPKGPAYYVAVVKAPEGWRHEVLVTEDEVRVHSPQEASA